jgi:hydrophobe/amphiphile efflux-1 (HAE1) family protein
VAAPLENAINGVEHMIYMGSTSTSNGVVTIQISFDIGTDVDQAAQIVNNRVKQVETKLPQEVRRQGVTVEKGSSAFLQVLAFYSDDGSKDDLTISNYVTLNVLDSLKRVPGTTNVQIFGAKDYAMRIWLRPDRLAQLKLTTTDIARAVNEQNAQFAAGKVGQAPTGGAQEMVYTITTQGRLSDPKQFEEIIVRANPDGSTLRLKDVARVELGSKDYDFIGRINGKAATLVGIFLQPGANALNVAKEVERTVDGLSKRFPKGIVYSIPYDTTRFVKVSIEEVAKTLAEAMILVILVVYLFLQNWRATFIPVVAVPVSLIGTMAGLLLLGYSINTLTLFGMVLAIGIVVDDAIVVLENVERIMHEEKMAAREAAIKAMREVSGPVIAIVLTLCAVFVPIAFPRRPHRRAVPAIRRHDLDRGGDLGHRRAHADAEPVRDPAQARAQGAGSLLRGLQPGVSAHHRGLRQGRRLHGAARRGRPWRCSPAWWCSRSGCGASRRGRWSPMRTRASTSRR